MIKLVQPIDHLKTEAIEALKQTLNDLESGEITSVYLVVRFNDGSFATRSAGYGSTHERAGRLLDLAISELGYAIDTKGAT